MHACRIGATAAATAAMPSATGTTTSAGSDAAVVLASQAGPLTA